MRSIIGILLFCACVAGLSAQGAPAGQSPVLVSLKFRLLAWGVNIPELAFGKDQKTDFVESGDRSAILGYSGPQLMTFSLPGSKVEKDVPPPVIASASLPLGVSKVTLLTLPAKGGRLGMYAISEDGGDLPPRHARLHNFSSATLRIIYNKNQLLELAPGTSALLSGEKNSVVVRVAAVVNGEWRQLFNNVIELDAKEGRNVLLIRGSQGGGIGLYPLPLWPVAAQPPESSTVSR